MNHLEENEIIIGYYKKPDRKILAKNIISIKYASPIPVNNEFYYFIETKDNETIEVESRVIHLDLLTPFCNSNSIPLIKVT